MARGRADGTELVLLQKKARQRRKHEAGTEQVLLLKKALGTNL